jgi:hypothetical protein
MVAGDKEIRREREREKKTVKGRYYAGRQPSAQNVSMLDAFARVLQHIKGNCCFFYLKNATTS